MSESRTVHERMVAIIAELPPIGKDQVNQQQGFKFRGHDDVLNALNPLLAKHGVFIVPDVLERIPAQRVTAKGNVMFEVNLHVRFFFYGAAGDSVTASTWGEGTDSGDKATNKAMTMAFKNVLIQAFAINTHDNIDADHETPQESVGRTPVPRNAPYVPIPSGDPDDPGSAVLFFGKHKDQTIQQVWDGSTDEERRDGRTYVNWLAYKSEPKTPGAEALQAAAIRFLTELENEGMPAEWVAIDDEAAGIPFN